MLSAYVISDSNLTARIKGLTGSVRRELAKALWRITLRLQREVKENRLSGQVLHVRTGTLRRSIHAEVQDQGHAMYGKVGTNISYGAAHEFGFTGPAQVRAHMRTIKEAWGRPLKSGPRQISVSSFTRHVSLPERSFLRSALEDMRPAITAELEQATRTAAKDM